jgi:hypothetical protein
MGAIGLIIATQLVTGIVQFGMGLATAIPKLFIMAAASTETAVASITAAEAISLGVATIGIIAGIAAAMGAFNSAKSQAASSTTPGLAVGGTVTKAGSIMVGENGPEILSSQPGATVTPLTKANAATIATPQQSSPVPGITPEALSEMFAKHTADAISKVSIRMGQAELNTQIGIGTRRI